MSYMKAFLEDVAEEMELPIDHPDVLEAAQDRMESGDLPQATVERIVRAHSFGPEPQRKGPPLDIDGFSVRRHPITGKPDYS